MDEKKLRLELKTLLNIDIKQEDYKEIEYPHLKKLVSKLIKKSSK